MQRPRLTIISAMPHHRRDGRIVGWGPTVRELDQLATRFARVRHVACLSDEAAPASAIPYSAPNIELVPVRPAGGPGVRGKLDVLIAGPTYVRTILRELADTDMVHVRAPANIALIAALLLSGRKRPQARWFKYAGNWRPGGIESPSYILQRWLLERGLPRGIVTVNGEWPEQPSWVRTLWNPSLTQDDVRIGRASGESKRLTSPVRLLFVGRIESTKGAGRAIEILKRLRHERIDAVLDLVGDGAERPAFEALTRDCQLDACVTFHGWLPPTGVYRRYAEAHIQLLPTSCSEGWPKVLSEGMAYGVVPVSSTVSSIPQYLEKLRTGVALRFDDLDGYVAAIHAYVADPSRWKRESLNALEASRWFTFDHYLTSVDRLLSDLGVGAPPS